jgi:hypothetical protein
MISFVTVEDLNATGELHELENELSQNSVGQLTQTSCSDEYAIFKYESDCWGDEKDLCSDIVITLLELGIFKFAIYYEGDGGD